MIDDECKQNFARGSEWISFNRPGYRIVGSIETYCIEAVWC
jgi:hypothetical protein